MESARGRHAHCETEDETDLQRNWAKKCTDIDYFSCQDTPQISNGAVQGSYSKLE